MKIQFLLPVLLLVGLFPACRQEPAPVAPPAPAAAPEETAAKDRLAPDELFGDLFRRVQMERIFADGKTFVDMVPKADANEIMEAYVADKDKAGFNLKVFTEKYFAPPMAPASGWASDGTRSITEHITALWPILTRKAGADEGAAGSLIPLPNDYVVPGGRFREVYYWDSYFTLLGLQTAGKHKLVRDMVENFAYLIDEVGHIPNGNRTYYLTRSQPPFFALMVEVLEEIEGTEACQEFLPQLIAEHEFWMSGAEQVSENNPAVNHVVRMPDGSLMNRYYDAGDRPRAESYREDVLAIRESGRDSQTVARHLRSGAESGWDYSARWFADGKNISTIITTDIIPPDLNSLLFELEELIADLHPDTAISNHFLDLAIDREEALHKYLWNPETNWFEDYNWVEQKHTGYLTLAGLYPFFCVAAGLDKVGLVIPRVREEFLAPGGLRASLVDTDQQWDAPNGWPPLQWIGYQSIKGYDDELADEIRKRWMDNNERVYANVNKMVEKYNVEDITLEAGGGEYPVQDGFGWSNGVYLRMAAEE
jgi:alpha,alpha-trehalase